MIKKRLSAAIDEMRRAADFDYVIMNDHLATAVEELVAVIKAARCQTAFQKMRHPALFALEG